MEAKTEAAPARSEPSDNLHRVWLMAWESCRLLILRASMEFEKFKADPVPKLVAVVHSPYGRAYVTGVACCLVTLVLVSSINISHQHEVTVLQGNIDEQARTIQQQTASIEQMEQQVHQLQSDVQVQVVEIKQKDDQIQQISAEAQSQQTQLAALQNSQLGQPSAESPLVAAAHGLAEGVGEGLTKWAEDHSNSENRSDTDNQSDSGNQSDSDNQ